MRKILSMVLLLTMALFSVSLAYAEHSKTIILTPNATLRLPGLELRSVPRKCLNCQEIPIYFVSCGAFNRWTNTAVCRANVHCTKRTSLYTTKYECANCG